MREIIADKNLIAFCGLYCGSCSRYLKENCPGCINNEKASWCKTRTCCLENSYKSCADCGEFSNALDCKKFNNSVSKIFGFIFRSDRPACISFIKEKGYNNFAAEMAEKKRMSIKR